MCIRDSSTAKTFDHAFARLAIIDPSSQKIKSLSWTAWMTSFLPSGSTCWPSDRARSGSWTCRLAPLGS
eukprot:5001047-Alexandrium_andersonii.AAC.1